jgi:hypothetical protein
MNSDNRTSRQQKINAIVRLSAGETPEQIKATPDEAYEMKAGEAEAISSFLATQPLPQYKALKAGIVQLAFDHPRQEIALAVMMQRLGITDEQFYYGIVRQLTNAISRGSDADVSELNAAMAMIEGIAPRDHLEVMLATQMVGAHFAAMRHTRSLMTVDLLPQMEAHERAMNKLMRTFTSQMEALRKHRNGGNQKVVVEHVHVHNGGQAIVGNVSHGGRSMKETETQSHGKENLSLSVGHLELPQSWRLPARFDG